MPIRTHLPREEWNKETVKEFIMECRKDKGVPMFRTEYGGMGFKVGKSPAVQAICWAGEDLVGSRMFTDVPKKEVDFLEESFNDWRRLIKRWGTKKEIKEAQKPGIHIKGYKLPKF